MPRLFTAIEIPEAIRMHLALVRAPLAGAKWIEPENMHITLARMRGGRLQAVARFLQENGGLHTQPFTATRFVLLSARPGSGGGPYVVEAEFPFEGTAGLDDAEEFADDPHAIE